MGEFVRSFFIASLTVPYPLPEARGLGEEEFDIDRIV